ncbi:MAG: pentapeptide repeat-containing protein [Blastocatellia bacterium]
MTGQSAKYEVWLSCTPGDRPWAEWLASRLASEGAAIRWPADALPPSGQWREWREAVDPAYSKFVVISTREYLQDERLFVEADSFHREHARRFSTERAIIPILFTGPEEARIFSRLRPIDFTNQEDFELRFRQLVEALELPGRPVADSGALLPRVSSALNSLFDWMGITDDEGRFEDGVAKYYELLGSEVERELKIGEETVDLHMEKRFGGMLFRTVIECFEKPPSSAQLDQLVLRQSRIRRQQPKIDCQVVTAQLLDEKARKVLEQNGIDYVTLPELLRNFIPLDKYVDKLIAETEWWRATNWEGKDWFIRPHAVTDTRTDRRLAIEHVAGWLKRKGGGLLPLLGDVGTGKSTLAMFVACEMAKAYKNDPLRHPAPVLIRLKDVRKETSLEGLVITHFRNTLDPRDMNDFSYPRFDHLVRQGRIVLFFDAFDEMAERLRRDVIRSNLDELMRPARNGGRVMITCRTPYFKDRREQVGYVGKEAVYLQEFSDEQVQRYLEMARPKTHKEDWKTIQEIYNLRDLVRRPLLLDMVVKGLPKLHNFNASTLYAKYVEVWFEREQTKGRILDKAVKFDLMKELAWKIWDEEKHRIHFNDLLKLVEGLKGVKLDFRGEDSYDVAEELGTASFLKRDEEGNYLFADPSFQEYFLACRIDEAIAGGEEEELRSQLRTRLFDPKMVFFLSLLRKRSSAYRTIRAILEAEYDSKASENALQILYWMGRCRSRMEDRITSLRDLRRRLSGLIPRGARLSNAKLSGVSLEGVLLPEANLHSADLTGACLDDANLEGASLRSAILKKARLNRVSAGGADFRESQLSGAVIRECDLRNVDFTGAIHREVDFEKNQTQGARGLDVSSTLLRTDLIPVVQQQFSSRYHSIAFGSGGEWYASGNQDGLIAIHRIRDDRLLFLLPGHRKLVYSLHFSPSEALLVSGGLDRVVRLWSVSDGRMLQEIEEHEDRVLAVRFSPDGRLVASAGGDKVIRLWLVEEGRALRSFGGFEGHKKSVNAIDFSPDGKRLASAGSDGSVRVWEVESGQPLNVIHVGDEANGQRPFEINAVRFSSDGAWLASTDDENRIRLIGIADGAIREVFKGHTDEVRSLCFSPDGRSLISGGKDRSPRIWSISNGELQYTLEQHADYIDSVHLADDGGMVMTGSTDRKVRAWIVGKGAPREIEVGRGDQPLKYGGAINAIALSPDGRRLASAGADPHVYLWATDESRLHQTLERPNAPVTAIDFSSDGQWLACGAEDGSVRIWSAAEGAVRFDLQGHEGRVNSVHFWPNRDLLITGSQDKTVRLWLVRRGELSNVERRHGIAVNDARFSPDGSLLAVACDDHSIWLWTSRDAQPPQMIRKFEGHWDGVLVTRFSPNGVYLASGGKDKTVRVWLIADGVQRHLFEGHTDRISSLAFSPGGKFLASGSLDGTVRIWELETGRLSQTLTGYLGEIRSLAITNNSRCLIAAGSGGRLQFWDLETGHPKLFRYGLDHDIWLDVMPNGVFHASEKGRRYLCYTEQGTLHSYPAETLLNNYQDSGAIQAVLKELVGPLMGEAGAMDSQ